MRWKIELTTMRMTPGAGGARVAAALIAVIAVAAIGLVAPIRAQPYPHFKAFTDHLTSVASVADAAERGAQLTTLFNDLRAAGRIPFAEGDSVAFLWRGSATSVSVPGDHSGWSANGQAMSKVGLSDVWMRVYRFPEAARIDYKFVVGSNWILDPNNPHTQMGGFGPNSELRMPAWVFPTETVRVAGRPQGTLSANLTLASTVLGYPVRYRVYTPPGYEGMGRVHSMYVTDGHEYLDDALGAVRIVMDNLAATRPDVLSAVLVFVDPRSVTTGANQRQAQYVQNPKFAEFMARELVPAIDAAYRTVPHPQARVILGTSLGGVFSLYLGILYPDTFGHLAMQSPAFWVTEDPRYWSGPSLYSMAESAFTDGPSAFISTGTIGDVAPEARRMRDILLAARGWDVDYVEVPEGHSWGNWRALIDEVAISTLHPFIQDVEEEHPTAAARLEAWPNPSAGTVTFAWEAWKAGDLACFDLRGRLVARAPMRGPYEGRVERTVRFEASGTYLCRLSGGGTTPFDNPVSATRVVTVTR